MVGEVIAEAAGGVLKFVGRVLFEVGFEFLFQGTGYFLCRLFGKKNVDPDGWLVAVVGLAFWITIGVAAYTATRLTS